ncbi:MAG TPA: hypothetical protein VLA44_00995 [Clostridia bacterium]|nr:hypothetical protein [Clostridia bacterium]
MILETVILTAVPNGLDDAGRLRLSVHVAPRLTTDDDDPSPRELAEYPAFETWAEHVAGLHWTVEFDNGPTAEAHHEEPPEPELWKRLFPGDTFVRPHAFTDHAKKSFHSFPVREVLQFIEGTYAQLAADGPELPSLDGPNALTASFGPLAGLTDQVRDSKSFWDEVGRAEEAVPLAERDDGTVVRDTVSASSGAANSLFEAYRFYYRPGDQRTTFDPAFPPDHVEPPPDPPDFDFHDLVGLLADHPQLQRKLGLVVDLVVDLEDPHGQLGGIDLVRVVPDGHLPEGQVSTPWTRFDLEDRWFGARPRQPFLMERGLVRLTREFWDLFQVDVDGAALQSVGFGNVLAGLTDPDRRNAETPTETGAPALRSGGFSLARQGRADTLLDELKLRRDVNALIEHGSTVVLDAEDLVRGYRFDVFDAKAADGERWFSLHERETIHHVGWPGDGEPEPLDPIRDEGFLKTTSASGERKDHPKPSDDLYLHETVASWDGWSLAAPRPGKRIVEPGEGEDGGASPLARHDPTAGQLRPLRSEVTVAPKSLPRLRVGHVYRVRLRTVDIAGNSVPFTPDELADPESELASEAQLAMRFEPVPSPTVLRRHLDTEGESLEHLVIRSNGGVSAKDYAASDKVEDALAGAAHRYAEDSQRHLAPPKGSMQMAEYDGKFDPGMTGSATQVTGALRVALREEGTFLDPKIVDTGTGLKTVDQSTISVHPPGTSVPTVRGSGLSGAEDDPDKKVGGAYAYYPDGAVVLPYLPDPMAIGIAIVGYDHAGSEVFHHIQLFAGKWPALEPFRVRLSELSAPEPPAPPTTPTIAFDGGVLEVRLPKAEVIRAKLSSVFPDGRLEEFAIWNWTAPGDRTPDLQKAAVAGRHWMLTPHRWLTFTHAVQQPLLVPDASLLTVSRGLGQTYASFDGPIRVHARSTGRLDVFGHWTEDVDLIDEGTPKMARSGNAVVHDAQAFGFDLGPGEDMADVTTVVKGVARASRHEFGDTKYRRIVYHSVATTRFREYLPPAIAAIPDEIQRREAWQDGSGTWVSALIRDVPSSARPATPDVVQTLPSFRWERTDDGPVRTHVRRGKAIRVWLRRPWFSSGDGEQLGVVLEPATRLSPGWLTPIDVIDDVPFIKATASERAKVAPKPSRTRVTRVIRASDAPAGASAASSAARFASDALAAGVVQPTKSLGKKKIPGKLTPAAIHAMLQPYVTRWGSDPVWASRLPQLPPIVADFPARISERAGLTLDEVSPQAKVSVAGHEVYFDTDRGLWYSDIEIENGDSYYPFVRLALARYQPHSVDGAHLSRISMTDFMQLAPDRTAEVEVGPNAAAITVRGYSGENITGRLGLPGIPDLDLDLADARPNTTMRAVLERRPAAIPGDLGWEPAGPEVRLDPDANGFHVTWVGTLAVPQAPEGVDQRILITEIETFLRDMLPGDPTYMRSPGDFVRERIVYADAFEL